MYLLNPFLRLSCLLRQRPATEDRTERPPERKSLFPSKTDGGFGVLLGGTSLPAHLMEEGSLVQGKTEGVGVRNLLRQGHRLLALRQPLIRIAQVPQCQGSLAVANHTSILPMPERRGAVLLGVVECHTLRKMRVRSGDRPQLVQCRPQDSMRRHERAPGMPWYRPSMWRAMWRSWTGCGPWLPARARAA